MIWFSSVLKKAWWRLKLACLVLRGIPPSRLNPGDTLHALQTELASARAETNRLAAVLADASLDPVQRSQELAEARDVIAHLKAQVETVRTDAAKASSLLGRKEGESSAVTGRINDSIHVSMPKSVLREAREEEFKIVDVGAQMLDSAGHVYTELASVLSSQIVGFEPLAEERQKRLDKEKAVTILPHAVGSGAPDMLNVTRFNPASSLLAPDTEKLADFLALPEMLEVVEKLPLHTRKLDDIPEAEGCRFLKIDVQGGELGVLAGATRCLHDVLVVFVEVEFMSIYKSQPLFCQVHAMLEHHGFELLDLVEFGYGSYRAANCGLLQSRLLWADGIYVRNLNSRDAWTVSQLAQLACIGHFVGNKFDYSGYVLDFCDELHGTKFLQDYNQELQITLSNYQGAVSG